MQSQVCLFVWAEAYDDTRSRLRDGTITTMIARSIIWMMMKYEMAPEIDFADHINNGEQRAAIRLRR